MIHLPYAMKKIIFYAAVLSLYSCTSVPVAVHQIPPQPSTAPVPSSQSTPAAITKSSAKHEQKQPSGLTDKEIEYQIRHTIPSSFAPVTEGGNHIKIIYHDLDGNGYKDAFLLVIKKQEGISADIKSLSDVSGLADTGRSPVDYFLSVYLQNKGTMISMFRIPIGSRNVLNSFTSYFIKKNKSNPFGLNISFLTKNGTEVEWIFFSSYNRFSLFTTENTASVKYEVSDIDNDGIMDIIEWKHGLEEGTGYETYLTWYRWNGREFREKATTNVVRNLNNFLEAAAGQIIRKQWPAFLNNLSDKNRKDIIHSQKNILSVFSKIFVTPKNTEDMEYPAECTNFRSVVFPKIFENPFKIQSRNLKEVTLMVRFECYNGSGFIRSVRVAMDKNPFGKSEYFFILN